MASIRSLIARSTRGTVRLKLTLLYGGLFLVCGVALLAITYLLVQHVVNDSGFTVKGSNGAVTTLAGEPKPGNPQERSLTGSDGRPILLSKEQNDAMEQQARTAAAEQKAAILRQLLTQSGAALAIMAVVSVLLGWLIAGRILRRLRTITATVHRISTANLSRRLALTGPDDEVKELGDTFDDLLGRLEASFQAQRRFVANASHELRTPLTRQRSLAQVALADPDATTETLRAAHERILVSGAEQEHLIEELLTLAQGQSGLDHTEPLDLAPITRAIVHARQAEAQLAGLRVDTDLSPAPTTGSPRLAGQLAANLIDNAIRHNTTNGWITITTGTHDGRALLTVANTGPAIRPDQIERLLQPFQRLDSNRGIDRDGHGLGLSIAHAIAQAHHAELALSPRPHGGLAATIGFPAAPAHDEHSDHAATPAKPG